MLPAEGIEVFTDIFGAATEARGLNKNYFTAKFHDKLGFLERFLKFNPSDRSTAAKLAKAECFDSSRPLLTCYSKTFPIFCFYEMEYRYNVHTKPLPL